MEQLRISKISHEISGTENFITNCKGYLNVYFKTDLMNIEKGQTKNNLTESVISVATYAPFNNEL